MRDARTSPVCTPRFACSSALLVGSWTTGVSDMQVTDAPAYLGKCMQKLSQEQGGAVQPLLGQLSQSSQAQLQELTQRGASQPSLS